MYAFKRFSIKLLGLSNYSGHFFFIKKYTIIVNFNEKSILFNKF